MTDTRRRLVQLSLVPVLTAFLLTTIAMRGQDEPGRKKLPEVVTCYQQVMGLGDWKIDIQLYADSADHRYAYTDWTLPSDSAVVAFNHAYLNTLDGPAAVRRVVIHELTHLLTAELTWLGLQVSMPTTHLFGERVSKRVSDWPMWQELCK